VRSIGRLLLLRHAKSSWDDPTLPDRDRPLAPRGRRAVAVMAPHIGDVDMVLCSPARRTRETLDRAMAAGAVGASACIVVDEVLYGASAGALLRRIRDVPVDIERLLVIGHNPGLEDLALGLAGRAPDVTALRALETKFPTAALAVLDTGSWPDVAWGMATLAGYVTPRTIPPL
jgi:phosphohistidine phosphatase